MDEHEHYTPSQHIGRVEKSAISNFGTANNYNIQGDQYQYYATAPKPWMPPLMLPPRAQSFVGREEDLAWLLPQLMNEEGVTLALCGPGGMGKTALVAEALRRLTSRKDWSVRFPDGIFYHSFYTSPSLAIAFEELARVFGEEPEDDPYRAARRAVSRRRALLVFDGLECLTDTRPLRALGGRNAVLVLSRRRSEAPDQAHRRDLGVLPEEQAITLLQKLAGPRAADRQCVERLVQHVSGYPLALQLIGSYLSSYQQEVRDYLTWFESKGLATINFGEHQDQSVLVLLQRTYDSLATNEQYLFLLQGLLAPAPFPLELVQTILELPEQAVRLALGELVNLSVLRRHLDQTYEVSHPLIHTFAKERLSSQTDATSSPSSATITKWREQFLSTLATHFEEDNHYDTIGLALWYPHVFTLLSTEMTPEQSLKTARLFNNVGFDALTQGKYALAEPLLRRALATREQQVGAEHSGTATSLNNLAELYYNQGKYTEAEPLYQRALAIWEQQLGPEHPDTAACLNNLALLYHDQGKYTEAEPLYVQALAIREQQVGPNHPDTAQSLNNLATLYYSQGKYTGAEPLLQRALAIWEQQLGAEHPDTAISLNNLATLYDSQDKYTLAEPLYIRALAIYENILSQNHPNTQTARKNYEILLQRIERERKRKG